MSDKKNETKKPEVFKILVDQKPFDWQNETITGIQIKQLVGAKPNAGVWLKVNGPRDDQPVGDNEAIDLTPPGREHFFTGETQTTEG